MMMKSLRGITVAFLVLTAAPLCTTVPAAAAETQRLNNLVTVLSATQGDSLRDAVAVSFDNPRDGWIHIGLKAELRADEFFELRREAGGESQTLLRATEDSPTMTETMRFMNAGAHTLIVHTNAESPVSSLSIRTMPETHFVRFPQEPRFPGLGTFDWPWLRANVLSSVNTVVLTATDGLDDAIDAWTGEGRKMIRYGNLPHQENITGEESFAYWNENEGFQDPRLSGLIADEFQGRQHALYPSWIEGMRLLGEKARGTGRAFYAYCGGPGMYGRPRTRELVRTVFDAGFYMAWERYHHELPTLPEAEAFMDGLLGDEMAKWQAAFPECQKQMVLVLGIFAGGPDLDVQPQVNYKVWMDMQMRYLATHPRFDGLFGVHWWYSGAATAEILRWQGALYRHYCIEGATDLLSEELGWTYGLDHIQNPDFYDGFGAWAASPAAAGAMKTDYLERYARIQNRYWQRTNYPDDPAGNTFLWTKRQEQGPNRVTQTILNLKPGALYSVQMITADYQDIINGRSVETEHGASLSVAGAVPVPELSYRSQPVSSGFSHWQLPFEDGPAQFNHHRLVFRATDRSATLTVSDWASDDTPGGPVGQELMINYLQLQPYFE